jgi:hypothetical protein
MAMTPEGKVKAAIKRVLDVYKPMLYYEMPVPSGYGRSGLDFEGAIRGYAFSVEAKAPGKKPTARQDIVIEQKRLAGISVWVVDNVNSPEIQNLANWLKARSIP